jgi:signal transduction histidine kinase
LIEAGRGLVSELDLDVILDRLLDVARELTGADHAALGVLDERREGLAQLVSKGLDDDAARRLLTPPQEPGVLGVPVLLRGEAWGNLYLTEKDGGGAFDRADAETAGVLADWAAIAIENARLYQAAEVRRLELERAVPAFQATADIARAVGGETRVDRVLELVVKRARALVEARGVLVMLVEGEDLVVAAGAGEVESVGGVRIPVAGSTSGEVLRDRRARRVVDAASQLRVSPEHLGIPDAAAALLVPLLYRGRALGVLAAYDRLVGDAMFSADDERVLQAFASQAATAVATVKTVEAERLRRSLEAAETERRRWARELHDETLQGLGGLNVLLSSASRSEDPDTMRSAMRRALEQVAHEIDNLRAIIADLRPATLDQLGLEPALRSLVRRHASAQGLDIEARVALGPDGERLDPELETAVYRLVQEALTNVVKHASATRVELEVRANKGWLYVRVADDGVGLPADRPTGFGLVGMRERVALLGGELLVQPGERGTIVRAALPAVEAS